MNSNILLKLIKFGIGFILFIPLYIGGSFFFPFIFPKIWLFQLVIEIIAFFYVILAVSDARFRPKLNLVLKAVILLTLALILTSFTGVDVFRSFWGNTERMSGIIAWFHFVAFAVILSGVLSPCGRSPEGGKTEKEWRNFFGIAAIVSILEFFYVLAQYFEASWVWLPQSQIGTIGNADLLGSYAIFSAFFALYLWKNYSYKWLWATAFFANLGTFYFAGSRGAMLGFLSGFFVFVAINFWQSKNFRRIFIVAIIPVIILYGIIWSMRNSKFIENSYQLSRITRISFSERTIQQRFTEWGIAWNAFLARPIFGYGPNNYLYLHNKHLNPRVYNLDETNFDRAHNAYLDYASMSGVLGLLGYIFLIIVLFWIFCPPTGDLPKGEKMRLLPFASLMVAYAVQSFFVFDSPASYIALFLTIGFAIYSENSKSEILNPKQIQDFPLRGISRRETKFSPQTILAISIFYFLFSIFLIYQVSIKPAEANYKFVKAFNDPSVKPEEAFRFYKEALTSETLGTSEFRNQYINWLQKTIANFKLENRLEIVDFGISELEKEIKDHPLVFSYLNLGQMYTFKARNIQDPNGAVKRDFFEKATAAFDKALELAPKRLEVYFSYLQLCLDIKNYNRGVEIMKRAVEAAPNYSQTHWYLGLAYVAAGDDSSAIASINKALSLQYIGQIVLENGRLKYDLDKLIEAKRGFAPVQEILGAVSPYIRQKIWPELLVLYISAMAKEPDNIQIHQSLALVYQNLGLTDRFQEELKIIEDLQSKK